MEIFMKKSIHLILCAVFSAAFLFIPSAFAGADVSVSERGDVSCSVSLDLSDAGFYRFDGSGETFVPAEGDFIKSYAVLCLLSDKEIDDISSYTQDEIKNMTVFVSGGTADGSNAFDVTFRLPSKSGTYTVVIVNPYTEKIYKSFDFESKLYFDYNDALLTGEDGVISFIEQNGEYTPIDYDAFSLLSAEEKRKIAVSLIGKGEVKDNDEFNRLFEGIEARNALFETSGAEDVLKYIKAASQKENSMFSGKITDLFLKKIKEEKQNEVLISLLPSKADGEFLSKFHFAVLKAYTENFEYFAQMSEIIEDKDNIWEFSEEDLKIYNALDNKNAVLSDMFAYMKTDENMTDFDAHFKASVKAQKAKEDAAKEESGTDNRRGSGGGGGSKGTKIGTSAPYIPAVDANKTDETGENEVKKPSFSDLKGFDWAKDSIDKLYQKGVLSGKSETVFAPSDLVTREEFVKMITLALGLSGSGAQCGFSDVSQSDWFYSSVAASVRAGIVSGVSKTEFGTGRSITREDMAVIIERSLNYKNVKEEIKSSAEISDMGDVSDYAQKSVERLVKLNVLSGYTDNSFKPKNSLTRAEASVVIYKVLSLTEEITNENY